MSSGTKSAAPSTAFLDTILKSVPYGLVAISMEGKITLANKLAIEYLHLEPEKGRLKGKALLPMLDEFPVLQVKVSGLLHDGKKRFGLKSAQFGNRFLDIRGRSVAGGLLISISNVTDLKEMEARLLSSMMEGQEAERRRLAQELHDGIGPMLSAVRLHLESLRTEASPANKNRLELVLEMLDEVAGEVRGISHALMPRVLLDFGLSNALQSLTDSLTKSKKLAIEYLPLGDFEDLDKQVALALYRSAQELISNAMKHAKPNRISIQLIRHTESVVLMVEDNGAGMDQAQKAVARQGIGLLNIESRVVALGGNFVLDTVPNRGTVATIEILI